MASFEARFVQPTAAQLGIFCVLYASINKHNTSTMGWRLIDLGFNQICAIQLYIDQWSYAMSRQAPRHGNPVAEWQQSGGANRNVSGWPLVQYHTSLASRSDARWTRPNAEGEEQQHEQPRTRRSVDIWSRTK